MTLPAKTRTGHRAAREERKDDSTESESSSRSTIFSWKPLPWWDDRDSAELTHVMEASKLMQKYQAHKDELLHLYNSTRQRLEKQRLVRAWLHSYLDSSLLLLQQNNDLDLTAPCQLTLDRFQTSLGRLRKVFFDKGLAIMCRPKVVVRRRGTVRKVQPTAVGNQKQPTAVGNPVFNKASMTPRQFAMHANKILPPASELLDDYEPSSDDDDDDSGNSDERWKSRPAALPVGPAWRSAPAVASGVGHGQQKQSETGTKQPQSSGGPLSDEAAIKDELLPNRMDNVSKSDKTKKQPGKQHIDGDRKRIDNMSSKNSITKSQTDTSDDDDDDGEDGDDNEDKDDSEDSDYEEPLKPSSCQSTSGRSKRASKSGKKRPNWPQWQRDYLLKWIETHPTPYPSADDKKHFCQHLGRTDDQIANWFINWRMRYWDTKSNAHKNGKGNKGNKGRNGKGKIIGPGRMDAGRFRKGGRPKASLGKTKSKAKSPSSK